VWGTWTFSTICVYVRRVLQFPGVLALFHGVTGNRRKKVPSVRLQPASVCSTGSQAQRTSCTSGLGTTGTQPPGVPASPDAPQGKCVRPLRDTSRERAAAPKSPWPAHSSVGRGVPFGCRFHVRGLISCTRREGSGIPSRGPQGSRGSTRSRGRTAGRPPVVVPSRRVPGVAVGCLPGGRRRSSVARFHRPSVWAGRRWVAVGT